MMRIHDQQACEHPRHVGSVGGITQHRLSRQLCNGLHLLFWTAILMLLPAHK